METPGASVVAALEARRVTMEFPVAPGLGNLVGERRVVSAVKDVSLRLPSGSATALVGESGSGKSTLARLLAGLSKPTKGDIHLDGAPVEIGSVKAFRRFAGQVQLILQDPYASLNPHRTIGYHVTRPLKIHGYLARRTPTARVVERGCQLLEQVGLSPGINYYYRYPHQLSGGQRQRTSIARALAAEPRVLIADEPVSMLDVSLRRGILELLGDLQKAGLTILYITHDLPSASYFAETIAVMYAGRIVEEGPAREVVDRPAHPYTRLLLASTPDPFADDFNQLGRALSTDQGEPPSLAALPSGCSFHPRCPHAMPVCRHSLPTLEAVGAERRVSCWLHDEAASAGEPVPFTTNQRTAG